MLYAKVINDVVEKFPYTFADLKADNPNTSFPSTIPEATLAEYNVYPVIETTAPAYDAAYQVPTYTIEGAGATWTQTWQVSDAGVSDEDLRNTRYAENAAYADAWILPAKLNPVQGQTYTEREVQKQENRRNNKGRANDITKVSDADDYLFNWIDTVYDSLDLADDAVETADRATLEAYDPATAVVWPAWTPYV